MISAVKVEGDNCIFFIHPLHNTISSCYAATLRSLSLVRDLGKKTSIAVATTLLRGRTKPGVLKPVEAKYRNKRNQNKKRKRNKGKRKGWVRRKQLNDNVY